jgi:NAD(P)H-dependent flavin oxidoreductase YrpB (nitropropane dioxygenase family)
MNPRNTVAEALGVRIPIVQAPIGNACTVELVSAVAEAGGLGMFAGSWRGKSELRELIRAVQARTDGVFGVNLVLAWPEVAHDLLMVCMEEEVRAISLFWGDPAPYLERLDGADVVKLVTVASAEEARRATGLGADVIVAQGYEAGGHVWGQTSTMSLVPAIADAVEVPVLAAGGIADSRGIAAALSLGAAGVWMGTRFIATAESGAHPQYKQAILDASETDTAYGKWFDLGWPGATHRTLRNATVEAAEAAPAGQKPGSGEKLGVRENGDTVVRYDDAEPLAGWTGRIDEMCLYAGEGSGLIHDIPSASELVPALWQGAADRLRAVTTDIAA